MQGEKQPLLHAPRGARAPPSAESPLQQRVRGPASLAGADGHSQLPAGWEAYWDEEYKRYYYYNAATGESTWTKPQPEEEEEEEPEPKEEEEPEPQEDAWGDKVPAAAGSDAEGGQEVDDHDGKDAWGDKVARHDGNRRYPTAKQGKPNLDKEEARELAACEEARKKAEEEAKKKAEEEAAAAAECVVCFKEDGGDLRVFVPCGHLCVCAECADMIMAASKQCPMCNGVAVWCGVMKGIYRP